MAIFHYGTTEIEYSIEHHEKSDFLISIDWINGLTIKAPSRLSLQEIDSILKQKGRWIIQKLNELQTIENPPRPKEFVSGEKFTYLGRRYRLKVVKDKSQKVNIQYYYGKFLATVPIEWRDEERQEALRTAFKEWYIQHGQIKVNERLQLYSDKLGIKPLSLTLKEQKRRWGTCTADGHIYLNWTLMMAPVPVIDYVIVHELAHLKHMNHSKDYWKLVKALLPQYKEHKEWLKNYGPLLSL